jgi:hypothetical protein
LQQLYLGGPCLVRRSYCLVTFDSSELVLIKILYFGSNLLNAGNKRGETNMPQRFEDT